MHHRTVHTVLYLIDIMPVDKYDDSKYFIQPTTVLYVVNGVIRYARWICNIGAIQVPQGRCDCVVVMTAKCSPGEGGTGRMSRRSAGHLHPES